MRHGTAIEVLEKMTDPIDLLYIDCVKEEYPRYLEIAAPKLAPRGLVVADNVLWMGQVGSRHAGRAGAGARSGARGPSTSPSCHEARPVRRGLPLGDGVALAVKI